MSKPLIIGILNVTKDSFSDGGKYLDLNKAIKKALEIQKEGADILDIGAEASGPNSKDISPKEQLSRLLPLLAKLKGKLKIPISIDTYKSEVAEACLKAGASIINDITALRGDKKMAKVIAKYQARVILMYSKDSTARTTIKPKKYKDVTQHIGNFLKKRIQYATTQGIKTKNIIIDTGMGHFISAIPQYSFEIIANLNQLKLLKVPVLIGFSRKSFLGGKIEERDHLALPLNAIAYLNGASIIRTHDVTGTLAQFNHLNK